MARILELARAELQRTIDVAEQYQQTEVHHAEILRTHITDLTEDITTLEKHKNSFKEREEEMVTLINQGKRIKRDMDREAKNLEITARNAEARVVAEANRTRRNDSVKTPRIKLPKFDGESSSDYRGFMTAFYSTIGAEDDSVKKWLLLKPQLTGKALQMVEDLPIAPETYAAATKILEDNYGGDRTAVLELYQKLQLLPNATLESASLKLTHARMEGILMSLGNLKVDLEKDDFLRAVAISKFPDELQHILRINNKTTLKTFRQELSEYVASRNSTIRQVITTIATGAAQSTQTMTNQSGGLKGGAEGSNKKQRHGMATSSTSGGASTNQAPPHQVPDNNLPKLNNNSKSKSRSFACFLCAGAHWADECDVYKTVDDRMKHVGERCLKCLKKPHPGQDCKKWRGCCYCQSMEHNRALCPRKFGTVAFLQADTSTSKKQPVSEFMTILLQAGNTSKTEKAEIRAILDTGGGRTLITTDLVEQLKLQSNEAKAGCRLLGVNRVPLTKGCVRAQKLLIYPDNGIPIQVVANVVDEIVDETVATDVAELKKRYPQYANLRMPPEGNGKRVQLLLGYRSLANLTDLQSSLFVEPGLQLMATSFGWVPFGDLPGPTQSTTNSKPVLLFREVDPVKLMTDLDVVGLTDFLKNENDEEEAALEKFHKTTTMVDGRYQVEWPWRYEEPHLQDNFGLAWGRLQSLYRQLNKTPKTLEAYDRVINEHLANEIIEEVVDSQKTETKKHYLPHRAVIRLEKSTPLRLVFDASARCGKRNKSLNDNILKGGNWVTELPAVLIRFRRYGVAVTSDIEKAFHQIAIAPKDRDVVRFLWLKDTTKPPSSDNIRIYRFKRMAFGVIASPFLLSATIKHHLQQHPNEYATVIESDLYADNLVVSLPRTENVERFYETTKKSFQKMSMNIGKWTTNDIELRNRIEKPDRIDDEVVGVLGLIWNTRTDRMNVKSPKILETSTAAVTKRSALTEMAKVYDPLGWMLPVVLRARIFIRKLWQSEYSWDASITKELADDWLEIRRQLNRVDEVKIQRVYGEPGLEQSNELELHAFCDASGEAYGVVIYLVSRARRAVKQSIVASKARLAPKTKLSTPRLELLAAVIATRYTSYVERALKMEKIVKYLWGDSRCVIAWTTSKRVLPGFVEKSAKEIRDSGIQQFAYVPSQQNPADVTSRGATIEDLRVQNWWNGPEWLSDRSRWPDQKLLYEKETEELEKQIMNEMCAEEERILFASATIRLKNNADPKSNVGAPFQLDPNDFSSLRLLIKRSTTCLQAIAKMRQKTPPTATDYVHVRNIWIRWDQHRIYEPTTEQKNTNVTYLRNLRVFKDEDGLIRCETRMKWAQVSRDESEPILLVKGSALTKLLILSIHENNMHSGTSHTLAALRRRYWLPHGRREVYAVIDKYCHFCTRQRTQPYRAPIMAPLPPFRITRTEKPFQNVGIDIFGPIYTRNDKNGPMKKKWVAIFTCLVIRAIHLETLNDMKADEFLFVFRKFVARWGTPATVVSDNAPQFAVVDGVFKDIWTQFKQSEKTGRYFAQHGINWKFIPPSAPWMGGVYERLIQDVKKVFDRIYGKQILPEHQFELAMLEISAVVNSRPITYVSKDKDAELITPNDFLCVRYPAMPIDFEKGINITTKELAETWKAAEEYLNQFWRVWSQEYLRSLRERRDTMRSGKKDIDTSPRVGEIVLMVEPEKKRSTWEIAVVERLIADADGKVRSVQIKAPDRARMIRPVTKLAPLRLLMDLPEEMPELNVNARTITVLNEPGEIVV